MKQRNVEKKYSAIPQIKRRGAPRKFETVEALEEAIQEYFDSCFMIVREQKKKVVKHESGEEITYDWVDKVDKEGNKVYEQIKPFTVVGLANSLDMSRETLLQYEKNENYSELSDTVKRAKRFILQYAEEYMFEGKNQTSVIFNLKNNWGYVDRTETDVTTKGKEINPAVVNAKVDDILKND